MLLSVQLSSFVCLLLSTCLAVQEMEQHGTPVQRDEGHYEHGEHNTDFDHQSILGSNQEADKFKRMSPQQAKERLGELVDKMDMNGDGFVDDDELTMWISNSFKKLNAEAAGRKMSDDDRDKDGSLSWNEFLVDMYGMNEDEIEEYRSQDIDEPEAKAILTGNIDYDKKKFDLADSDKNGKLSVEELSAFMHPYDYARMIPLEVSRTFEIMDKDKDGNIVLAEYQRAEKEEDKRHEAESFKHFDKNGDGMLDQAEVTVWVAPDIMDVARNEAQHLIHETDRDRDGKLTKKEIVFNHHMWVGSGATSYGSQMHPRDEL